MKNEDEYADALDSVLQKIRDTILRKHHDYGTKNLLRHGLFGILVRIDDKSARLNNLLNKDIMVRDESIEDTFIDLAGYAIQAILMLTGKLK